jgi:uncharacterized membrane protein
VAESEAPAVPPDLERVVFFSDAVLAIAITLLVLEIKVPELPWGSPPEAQLEALLELWPKYIAYISSFWVIGLFWTIHRRILRRLPRGGRLFNVLNLLFLFCVAFLPFPTAVMGDYGPERVPVGFSALWLMLVGAAPGRCWR